MVVCVSQRRTHWCVSQRRTSALFCVLVVAASSSVAVCGITGYEDVAQKETYDYIIVGGGTSGAILASRLTEDPNVTVLVVEAGPDYRQGDEAPEMRSANPVMVASSPRFAQFRFNDIKARRTITQEQLPYLRGRGLGGCSNMNGQIAIRGTPADFDLWADGYGCKGWSYADVLPFFKRMERDLTFGEHTPYHGTTGPVPIHRNPLSAWGHVDKAHRQGAMELGLPWSPDQNAPGAAGVSHSATNRDHERRYSTNDAYLEQARDRPNLTILADTTADRVVFEGKRAVGVAVFASPNADNARANLRRTSGSVQGRQFVAKEVILAAGVVHSPAVLMRSGVGPRALLDNLGIGVVHASDEVGRNFHEHPIFNVLLPLLPDAVPADPARDRSMNCASRFSSKHGSGDAKYQDDLGFLNMNSIGDPSDGPVTMGAFTVALFGSFSRGHIDVVSTSPWDQPRLEQRLLSEPSDLPRLREGVRMLLTIATGRAFKNVTDAALVPGVGAMLKAEHVLQYSDEQLDSLIMSTVGDGAHGSGTCAMGKVIDPESLRVYGVDGLRVIDASSFPISPRANSMLTVMMFAEKASAHIARAL